jgi:hypothetical protein
MEEKNFKNYVKSETRKARMESISEFFSNNADVIARGIYICSFIFVVAYLIWGAAETETETTIIKINKIENAYDNSTDTTYIMSVKSHRDSTVYDVDLTKDSYTKYLTAYKKGITKYLDTKTHIFYFLCLIYLNINLFILLGGD